MIEGGNDDDNFGFEETEQKKKENKLKPNNKNNWQKTII